MLRTLKGHSGWVNALCALPMADGRTLLASGWSAGGSDDDVVRIWDPDTGVLLRTLQGHIGWVNAVCALATAGGRTLLASSGDDRMVRIWDPQEGRMLHMIHVHHPTYAIAHTGDVLVVGLSAGLLGFELTDRDIGSPQDDERRDAGTI